MVRSEEGPFDLIGDVHGAADALRVLLGRLGYAERRGAYRHPERRAVFVGDLLDRGPQIREALALVRAMVEAGSALAVVGNHEWNAFLYHQPDPEWPGEYLREHRERHDRQVAATLDQVPAGELASHLAFLRQLPLHLDLGALRVVHACWDDAAIAVASRGLARHGGLTDAFLVEAAREGTALFGAVEVLLKGREMDLPDGVHILDQEGRRRHRARTRWYLPPDGLSLAGYAFQELLGPAAGEPVPSAARADARPYPPEAAPVFFGHYAQPPAAPAPLAPNVACLDSSVLAPGGFLSAYRWDGERQLEAGRFVRTESMGDPT